MVYREEQMAQPARVFLFGDQTYDFVPDLQDLLRVQDNPILTAFLEQSHYVIRGEMNQTLAPAERKASRTSNLAHLLHKYRQGLLSPAFQTALACVCQLGSFIGQYGETGRPYPRPDETYVLGLCTGSLAAAAISSCGSLSELLPAAVQTVLVAFRLGLCVVDVRDRLEPTSPGAPQSWSVVFPGLEPDRATTLLDAFCTAKSLPKTSQPWIGATAARATTISGPPSVLKQLCESEWFSSQKFKSIPVYVPSHTSNLFTADDVRAILETTLAPNWSGYNAKLPVVSGATGRLSWAGTFRGLLERGLCECLLEPVRWDQVIREFPALMQSAAVDSVAITPIATTAEKNLISALKDSIYVAVDPTNTSQKPDPASLPNGKAKLAIVGMSGRFPEAQSPAAFWDVLYKGMDVCKKVPLKRWNIDTHVDPTGKAHNKGATEWGCWLDFAGQFDPRFFSISPKEAPQMDPAQRMALMSTFEAMEQAGIVPDNTASTQRDRIGVFHGVTSNDWMETNTAQDIDTYFITGGNRGFIPGRINFCFEFCGPSFTNDTACSSSLAAIHLACNSLWRGDCDTAIAGGTNMIFTPDGHTGLDKGFFLSRTGNCKPFDDGADGYCRAEGVGTVFIKRLEDALADRDPILAVILDTKTNHSAMSDSMTRPHVGAQVDNMSAVLNNACVDPKSLSYIEMHGTGTQVGDAVEMESVLSVFAPNESFRTKDQPLWVGSAKGNIGHGEGVSGVTSLAKVLLMMKNNAIPPHVGIRPGSKINRNYPDLGARNVHIAAGPVPWVRQKDQPRRVLINNFSAAGGNTALLLEDGPVYERSTQEDIRSSHVVTISGHVAPSLKKNMQLLLDFVKAHRDDKHLLADLSFTTTARRVHHLFRVSITASSVHEFEGKLQEAIDRGDGTTRAKTKPGVVFAFTGQGSQYMGMGKVLYDAFPRFQTDVRRFDQLARTLGFSSFIHIFTNTQGDIQQYPPVEVQLAMCSLQMALGSLLKSFGIVPSAVVGHSLGEYAALNLAGVLSDSHTLFLVGRRAELLQEHCNRGTHAMLAVKASKASLEKLLANKKYDIACINGPEDTVLSGSNQQVEAVRAIVTAKSIKSTLLKVPFAFHSSQVDPILESFKKVAAGATFREPTIPVICPLNGDVVREGGIFGPGYLADHCRGTVNMEAALKKGQAMQLINDKTLTIEVGPQPVVCGMVKATFGASMPTFPILHPTRNAWQHLTTVLASLYINSHDVNWLEWHKAFTSSHRVLELPAYAWDLKEYYIPYEGDWCLHRHQIECACADPNGPVNHTGRSIGLCPTHSTTQAATIKKVEAPKIKAAPEPASKPTLPKPVTTNIHKILEETIEALGATLIAETDISRPDTSRIAAGHSVNNIALCTPSVYADIAFVLGKYLMSSLRPGREGTVDVSDLICDKALIPHGKGPQLLRTKVTVKWAAKASGAAKTADCKFYSVDENGKSATTHAWCVIRFQDNTQLQGLQKRVPEYLSKIARLREGIKAGQFVTYGRTAGYKLMSTVATFHPDYKLLDKLILDESTLEACSKLNFSTVQPGGKYAAHPAYVDAITQVGGFAMNAKDSTDLDKDVFVNHGWESFQIYEEMRSDRDYEVYVQMHRHEGDLYHGDTIVLDGERVVAFFKGVSLRNVPRKALRMVLQQTVDKATRALGGKKASIPAPVNAPAVAKATPKPTPAPKKAATFAPDLTSPAATKPTTNSIAVTPKPILKTTAAIPTAPVKTEEAPADNAKVQAALGIISEESGVSMVDLTDDSNFADIGVDSLLSMVIGSRFREELDLDLDSDFSIFVDLPTVKELKDFLGGAEDQPPTATAPSTPEIATPGEPIPRPNAESFKAVPPPEISVSHPVVEQDRSPAVEEDNKPALTTSSNAHGALQIISEESGISASDLSDDSNFADIGVDSLLSMVIGSRFREELGLDLDADFSIFVDLPTVGDLKQFLAGGVEVTSSFESDETLSITDSVSTNLTTPDDSDSENASFKTGPAQEKRSDYCKPCTSVILQGMPRTAAKTIFLLPDGSGSASSYVAIPKLQGDFAVVGLNSPYARDPENMKCTHTALIQAFINEIRRRQPQGPYYLGGWSSGGAFAYVCAEALVNAGESVGGIVIVDAPVPQVMEHLPRSFYEYCNTIGLFGHDTEPPPYLIPHFEATVDTMMAYQVAPLKVPTHKMPKVGILWATNTVMDEKDAPKMKGMHFMIQERTDFGPDGWDTVLPGAKFVVERVQGANHFTLLAKENVHQVSGMIERILA